MFLYSALLVGLLGSFHCVGMCGPIALALPVHSGKSKALAGRLLYNSGRIVTYSILGILFGLLGRSFVITGFERSLSILAGAVILIIVFISLFSAKIQSFPNILNHFTSKLKLAFKNLFGKKSAFSLFLIGTVNGLLPCGFVYLALAAAAATGNSRDGFLYMMMFGIGTLPMMLSLSLAGNFFGIRFQSVFRKASPWIAAFVAVLLIYRGVAFQPQSCCHHH